MDTMAVVGGLGEVARRLIVATLSALVPALLGGKILQSYDIAVDLGPLGSTHLVTSVFFDFGVYLVVIGVMLDLARCLGAGIDQHEEDDRAPSPQPTLRSRAAAAARSVS